MDPLVSVVIPNYNYARFLRESIESVLSQTYRNIEIIVVDDGSTDDSRAIIESYGDRIISLFRKNAGVSASRNSGVSASKGEFIAFLDADDVWLPEKIESQVKLLLGDPSVGLVHTGLWEIDEQGTRLKERTDGMEGWVSTEMLMFDRTVLLAGGSGVMVRRSVFDEVGGFDTRLSTSADWDFGYSVAARHKVGFIPGPNLLYRLHNVNMHSNIKLMEQDTLLAWAKAFDTRDEKLLKLRRTAYGQLHRVLAGSYLHSGQYWGFMRNVVKSIWFRPALLGDYLRSSATRFGGR